jgi:hypothetical protein
MHFHLPLSQKYALVAIHNLDDNIICPISYRWRLYSATCTPIRSLGATTRPVSVPRGNSAACGAALWHNKLDQFLSKALALMFLTDLNLMLASYNRWTILGDRGWCKCITDDMVLYSPSFGAPPLTVLLFVDWPKRFCISFVILRYRLTNAEIRYR